MNGVGGLPAHVALADLREILKSRVGAISPQPSDSARAFLEAATFWVNEWAMKHGEAAITMVQPFALVYRVEDAPAAAGPWTTHHLFREHRPLEIGGLVAVTTTSMLKVQVYTSGCTQLPKLCDCIEALGLAGQPMLVVDPKNKSMIYAPKGLEGERAELPIVLVPITHLTAQMVEGSLNDFHSGYLEYPDGYAHIWYERSSRTMMRDAEAIVRDHLYLHFRNVTFQSQYVAREEQTTAGRPDVSIHDIQDQPKTNYLFELKVLRSRGMPKLGSARPAASVSSAKTYNEKSMLLHARMGVRQAAKYQKANKAKAAYICLYDGRDDDTPMPTVRALAQAEGIEYRKYYMQISTRDDLTD